MRLAVATAGTAAGAAACGAVATSAAGPADVERRSSRLRCFWYASAFVQARLTVYAVIAVMFPLMMVLPIPYACAASTTHCIGCGFRTAVRLLAHGNVAGAIASNALIIPAVLFFIGMAADLIGLFGNRKDIAS